MAVGIRQMVGGTTAIAGVVAMSASGVLLLSTPASAAKPDGVTKVWVCKFVTKPGPGHVEVLKKGKQPIEVSVGAIKGWDGTIPSSFADGQGRSEVIAVAKGPGAVPDPGAAACVPKVNSPSPTPTPTETPNSPTATPTFHLPNTGGSPTAPSVVKAGLFSVPGADNRDTAELLGLTGLGLMGGGAVIGLAGRRRVND